VTPEACLKVDVRPRQFQARDTMLAFIVLWLTPFIFYNSWINDICLRLFIIVDIVSLFLSLFYTLFNFQIVIWSFPQKEGIEHGIFPRFLHAEHRQRTDLTSVQGADLFW